MSTHPSIDRICLAGALCALVLALLFVNGEALGIRPASRVMGYETRLFDTGQVHTLDIVAEDWEGFLETCENEEYITCSVVIDGEALRNVGLRAKGNTSLSTVSAMGSDRYSFKLEFDHYDSGQTYYGLDKLCLNNLIQDNTCMKDYLTYQMMNAYGVAAPLSSYVFITVNGQDWGLYLAVEGVEDAFLQRNYGRDHGALYKPDSLSFGGGRGNGRAFDMEGFQLPEDGDFQPPEGFQFPEDGDLQPPEGFPGGPGGGAASGESPGEGAAPASREGRGFGGMGASDVKLQYTDDGPESYANIFDNAKTDVSPGDQARLIQALKTLGQGGDSAAEALDTEAVLRYFAVHNFVVNGDSYTGGMVHNYYLYESEGLLSMIPWDYNLAFGTFQAGSASGAVNDPIDTPLSASGNGDRPMFDWLTGSDTWREAYHQALADFLDTVDPEAIITQAYELIAPYVDRDPTKFCTSQEFETGVQALRTFCRLRRESVSGQLAGTVPSTAQGQTEDPEALVDASGLTLADMGTMGQGGGPGFPGGPRTRPDAQTSDSPAEGSQRVNGPAEEAPAANGPVEAAFPSDSPVEAPSSTGGPAEAPPSANGPTESQPSGGTRTEGRPSGLAAMGMPGGPEGGPPGQEGASGGPSAGGLLVLGASALALLAGLFVARRYRRWGV